MLPSLADTTDFQDVAQRTEVQSMLYEPGYEVQSGQEGDGACWLDAVLEREAELEEERLRASFAGSDPNPLDLGTPTICLQCGASFNTEYLQETNSS